MIGGKELRFEDPANGMAYWEALFQRLHRIELWSPSKQPTLRIGFPGGSRPAASAVKKEEKKEERKAPETSKDLKFLEEALSHIQELLTTLNQKIEEIDLVFALAVQDGHATKEDQSANAQERQLKRSQLLMLKENIDVIADNLKSLIQRSKQTGSALFDVAAIESVISEAATLLVLLNSDEEDDNEPDEEEETAPAAAASSSSAAPEPASPVSPKVTHDVAEVNKIDQLVEESIVVVQEVEDQIIAGDVAAPEILAAASVPVLESTPSTRGSLSSARAPSVHQRAASVHQRSASVHQRSATIVKEPVSELDINKNTFDPNDRNKRPEGWQEVLMKRVIKKDQADREAGIDEDTILAGRADREAAEDLLMCQEVAKTGTVQGLKNPNRRRGETLKQDVVSSLDINSNNFYFPDPTKRPDFWAEVRTKRVMLKEHIERINGTSEDVIVSQRHNKEIEEEMILTGEVLVFGRLLNVGENKSIVAPADLDLSSSARPNGWNDVREKRVQYKELEDRLNGDDEASIKARHAARLEDEDKDMTAEGASGTITILGTRRRFKAPEPEIPPVVEEVVVQEVSQINAVAAEAPETSSYIEEPVQWKDETITFGSLTLESEPNDEPVAAPIVVVNDKAPAKAPAGRARKASIMSSKDIGTANRPKGWAEIKLRKVYLKEWEDRKNGVDEDDILDRRYQRELEVRSALPSLCYIL